MLRRCCGHLQIITRNIYVSRQPPAISEDDIVRCQCDPKKGHRCSARPTLQPLDLSLCLQLSWIPRSGPSHVASSTPCPGPDDSCLNRILLTECTEGHCPTGDACTNQRFQRQTFAPLAIKETPGRGFGVVADGVIEEGELVAEYTGEVIAESEAERRARVRRALSRPSSFLTASRRLLAPSLCALGATCIETPPRAALCSTQDALSRGERHTYFMNLGGGLVIDARKKVEPHVLSLSSTEQTTIAHLHHTCSTVPVPRQYGLY